MTWHGRGRHDHGIIPTRLPTRILEKAALRREPLQARWLCVLRGQCANAYDASRSPSPGLAAAVALGMSTRPPGARLHGERGHAYRCRLHRATASNEPLGSRVRGVESRRGRLLRLGRRSTRAIAEATTRNGAKPQRFVRLVGAGSALARPPKTLRDARTRVHRERWRLHAGAQTVQSGLPATRRVHVHQGHAPEQVDERAAQLQD